MRDQRAEKPFIGAAISRTAVGKTLAPGQRRHPLGVRTPYGELMIGAWEGVRGNRDVSACCPLSGARGRRGHRRCARRGHYRDEVQYFFGVTGSGYDRGRDRLGLRCRSWSKPPRPTRHQRQPELQLSTYASPILCIDRDSSPRHDETRARQRPLFTRLVDAKRFGHRDRAARPSRGPPPVANAEAKDFPASDKVPLCRDQYFLVATGST